MAVFTPVSDEECSQLLAQYDVGKLIRLEPIAQGVENSNFHLHTDRGRTILTLFEKRVARADLPFFMQLKQQLSALGVPCPAPIAARDGSIIQQCNGRPAAIVSFLAGKDIAASAITLPHLAALGAALGQMHRASQKLTLHRANSLTLPQWGELIQNIGTAADTIAPALAAELASAYARLAQHWPQHLTRGIIHADCFPDNVFFDAEHKVCGIIDWYFACHDAYLYEFAIVMNAWCFDEEHRFVPERYDALRTAYQHNFPLPESEWAQLPLLAEGAALRFLLTRALDWLHPKPEALITPKNPMEYVLKWRFHRNM
jgi:homoserine kinase type II